MKQQPIRKPYILKGEEPDDIIRKRLLLCRGDGNICNNLFFFRPILLAFYLLLIEYVYEKKIKNRKFILIHVICNPRIQTLLICILKYCFLMIYLKGLIAIIIKLYTFPLSKSLVSITILLTLYCHIIRQKSATVLGLGPAIYVTIQLQCFV